MHGVDEWLAVVAPSMPIVQPAQFVNVLGHVSGVQLVCLDAVLCSCSIALYRLWLGLPCTILHGSAR